MVMENRALRSAGLIGTWSTDVPAGRSILDEGAAQLLAGDASLAGQAMPTESALRCMHPDDRGWVFDRIRQVRRTGGAFSAEFRVVTATGEIRRVLNRGNIAPDESGRMHGYGAYIDMTDTYRPLPPPLDPIGLQEADPLLAAADRCMEAHAAIDLVGDPGLRQLSSLLLHAVGRTLAGRMRD